MQTKEMQTKETKNLLFCEVVKHFLRDVVLFCQFCSCEKVAIITAPAAAP